jgi:hypothetical protein
MKIRKFASGMKRMPRPAGRAEAVLPETADGKDMETGHRRPRRFHYDTRVGSPTGWRSRFLSM